MVGCTFFQCFVASMVPSGGGEEVLHTVDCPDVW